MGWRKLGKIFSPCSSHPKLVTHAANPLPILLEGNVFRIFYSGRDLEARSSVGFVDIDIVTRKTVFINENPVFSYGPKDSFYSHGVSIGNCYSVAGQIYIGFMGWRIPTNQHWIGNLGRIKINNALNVACLESEVPFLTVDSIDPFSFSYPFIYSGDEGYLMWYGSTLEWENESKEMVHVINCAHSKDGHHWEKHGLAVPYELGFAQAFSRPSVVKDSDGYHMWFSYRSGVVNESYRIGYAFSEFGLEWELRLEESGIDVSEKGWDSEMIEYPYVFDHKGSRYLLYNGNQYGKTGFGLAIWDENDHI